MPKYPNEEPFLDETNNQRITRRKRCNCCNNNKDVCIIISTVACIILSVCLLTCLNVYFMQNRDGSLIG